MGPVCTLRDVSKRYDDRDVLARVNLTVAPGEMVVLNGPSGSGKSTLLSIAGLLVQPDRGHVGIFGGPAPQPSSAAAARALRTRVGVLFHDVAGTGTATVTSALSRSAPRADNATTGHDRSVQQGMALERVGLAGHERRPLCALTSSERQRLAIAMLMLRTCQLVIADEPTAALDPGVRRAVIDVLLDFRRRGAGIIIASHDPAIAAVSDRALGSMPA